MHISYWSSVLCSSDLARLTMVRRWSNIMAPSAGHPHVPCAWRSPQRAAASLLWPCAPKPTGATTARSCRRAATNSQSVPRPLPPAARSEEHTSELQSLMRISYAVFCLKKKKQKHLYDKRTTTLTTRHHITHTNDTQYHKTKTTSNTK